ncbi:hypothetical protein [Streptodolium elevatio]
MITETKARGGVALGLINVDSTTARAHHHAAGMPVDPALLEELVTEEKGLYERRKARLTGL